MGAKQLIITFKFDSSVLLINLEEIVDTVDLFIPYHIVKESNFSLWFSAKLKRKVITKRMHTRRTSSQI